jgi:hypothetical protein
VHLDEQQPSPFFGSFDHFFVFFFLACYPSFPFSSVLVPILLYSFLFRIACFCDVDVACGVRCWQVLDFWCPLFLSLFVLTVYSKSASFCVCVFVFGLYVW